MKTTRRGFFATVCGLFAGRKAAPEVLKVGDRLTIASVNRIHPENFAPLFTPAEYHALFHEIAMEKRWTFDPEKLVCSCSPPWSTSAKF